MSDARKVEVDKALKILEQGGLIVYPTDTIWGIGCDAANGDAIRRIYKLKRRSDTKTMICLVSDFEMLNKHVEMIPEITLELVESAEKPTTIIYDNPRGISDNLVADDNTLAIRLVQEPFCNELIEKFGKPIVSTSANISGCPPPLSFEEIDHDILKDVDYVVNLHRKKKSTKASTIIRLTKEGVVKVIRP